MPFIRIQAIVTVKEFDLILVQYVFEFNDFPFVKSYTTYIMF